jgi:hypothetical protein
MWERVKSGEWQYGRGLALAWGGERGRAEAEFDAAAEKFRQRGAEDMLARVSLHRLILDCRGEADPERRHRKAAVVASRLLGMRQMEDYRPPFALIAGTRVSECLWRDLERVEFLLRASEEEWVDGGQRSG